MTIGSIRMLRHFVAACQSENLHKAAKAQCLSQSAITKSIRQLESNLGVQLLVRTSRGVTPTLYGKALYDRARRVEVECDLIEKELSEMASGHGGQLRIGAGSVWSSMFLPRVLARLYTERPRAQFTVLRSSGARFADQFEKDEIDIGVGAFDAFMDYSDTNSADFVCEPLSEVSTSFFAHCDHPLHKLPYAQPKDLNAYPYAAFRQDRELQSRVGRYFAHHGLMQPHAALVSDSISGVMEILKVSPMITCLPTPLADIASAFGAAAIRTKESPWIIKTGIMHRKAGLGYQLLDDLVKELRRESAAFAHRNGLQI
uniref:LysR substrate-binding domain-containing protein n=1 Tax=Pararhizobium sp. IMCC3301 TaxID=3067904 RepID=UPI0027428722|nr:LysR family transcriptional regulator [Pararhizobium sp. IMCC3301]